MLAGGRAGLGTLAASSLVIGAVVALRFRIGLRAIGLIMGFGAGVLISAVAFDLVEEAVDTQVGAVSLSPASSPAAGSRRRPAHRPFRRRDRKDAKGAQESGSALAIVLGTVLDGIPESMVIGLTTPRPGRRGRRRLPGRGLHLQPPGGHLRRGRPGRRRCTGRASSGCGRRSRWSRASRPLVGYALFQNSPDIVAFVLAFAGGAILTMLADTMMPEAFEHGGNRAS